MLGPHRHEGTAWSCTAADVRFEPDSAQVAASRRSRRRDGVGPGVPDRSRKPLGSVLAADRPTSSPTSGSRYQTANTSTLAKHPRLVANPILNREQPLPHHPNGRRRPLFSPPAQAGDDGSITATGTPTTPTGFPCRAGLHQPQACCHGLCRGRPLEQYVQPPAPGGFAHAVQRG
jgi:hypothetical protein